MNKLLLSVFIILMIASLRGFGQQKSEWDVRVRGVYVAPQESATIGVIGGGINISKVVIPEIDFTYFFMKDFSAELILGTSRHKVNTTASNLTAIGGSSSADVSLGKVSLLPPTLTLQYHLPTGIAFKPYIGAGANYTIFYNANAGEVVKNVSYQNKFTFATQFGFDYDLNKKFFLNIDVKKVFLSTNATVDASNLTPASSPELAPTLAGIKADVKINPWLIGVGFGARFK